MAIQDFGEHFDIKKLWAARDVARDLTYELSSLICPGMTEDAAHVLYKELCAKRGIEKQWHPAKIRFGKNTLKNFKEASDPYVLKEEDLYFIDIGPVIDHHEADYGETFSIGSVFDHKHIADSSVKIFNETKKYWFEHKCSGDNLYDFAQSRAKHYGYFLNLGNHGHRIGDFPHHIFFRGGLNECQEEVIADAWILEIHLWNTSRTFGAFFEDLLTSKEC